MSFVIQNITKTSNIRFRTRIVCTERLTSGIAYRFFDVRRDLKYEDR